MLKQAPNRSSGYFLMVVDSMCLLFEDIPQTLLSADFYKTIKAEYNNIFKLCLAS